MSTTEHTTINGIDYRVTHIEASQRDIIVITGMDDDCQVKLGQLDICHDTESAWVEAQDGETFSVNYHEAGEADLQEAARIIEAHI